MSHPPPLIGGRSGLTRVSALAVAAGFAWLTVYTVRQRRRYENRLRQAYLDAATDPLTRLPNRRYVNQQLTHGTVGMIALLDLDHFKQVNDTHGHATGDELLVSVANRLRDAAHGDHAVAARLAGDEFVLLWTQPPQPRNSPRPGRPAGHRDHVERLLHAVVAPIDLDGLWLQVGISVGIAVPSPHLSGAGLLTAADAAMYQAKHSTRTSTTTAASTAETGRLRVQLWDGDHAPTRPDRRALRDAPTSEPGDPTGPTRAAGHFPPGPQSSCSPTSTNGAHRTVTEGTR